MESNLDTDKLWTNIHTLDNELKCVHSVLAEFSIQFE